MNLDKFAQEAFAHEPKLRYVGIVDGSYHVLLSRMRDGVQSLTNDEQDRNYLQLMPQIIVEAVEKMQPWLGKVDSVTARYEKLLYVFFRAEDKVQLLSFEPEVVTPFMSTYPTSSEV